jgi:hypothetical protein
MIIRVYQSVFDVKINQNLFVLSSHDDDDDDDFPM